MDIKPVGTLTPIESNSEDIKPVGDLTPIATPDNRSFNPYDEKSEQPASDRYIDSLSFEKGYNEDEKEHLKKIWRDPNLKYQEKADAVKTMGGNHPKQEGYQTYYVDKKGLPVPLAPGEKPPKGYDVESIWGTAPKDESLLATAGKHIANFVPDLIGAVGGAAATVQELVTDKDADWNTALQLRLKADSAKYSEKSEESVFKDIHSFSDLAHISKYNFTPENIVGNIAGLASTVGQFVVMNAMTGGLSSAQKVGKIASYVPKAEEMLALATEAEKAGTEGVISVEKATNILNQIKSDQKIAKGLAFGKQLAASAIVNSTGFTESADEAGLHGRDKAGYVTVGSTIAGLLEMELGIGNKILTAAQRTEKDAVIREGAKALARDAEGNITKESLASVYKNTSEGLVNWGKNVAKAMGSEATEEASQQFEQDVLEQLHDKFYGKGKKVGEGKFGTDIFTGKELKSLADNAFWGAFGGGLGNVKGKAEGQSNSIYKAIEEGPEAIKNMKDNLNAAVKSGRITETEKDLANFKIDTYQKYHSQLADLDLDNKQKRRLSDLTWSAENLKTQIAEDEKNPEVSQPILQNKLLTKKKLLADHEVEIKKIITKPLADEQTVTAEKTQSDLDKEDEKLKNAPTVKLKAKKTATAQTKKDVRVEGMKEVVPDADTKVDIDIIAKKTDPKDIDDYLTKLEMGLQGQDVPIAIQNAAYNRKLELEQEDAPSKTETVPTQKKKAEPTEVAKKKFAEHLEALNKLDDDFSKEDNFKAFELRKKLIEETSDKARVPVPKELIEAIKGKEESSKKRGLKNEISEIVTQSEKELDEEKTKLEALKKKGIKKNEVSFDKVDLDDDSDFIKQQHEDTSFMSFFKKHESFENEDTKTPSPGQKTALQSLSSTGILNEEEASHEGSTMADASSAIHEAVKRIQYLKVNAKTDAEAKKLKEYQSDIMKMMSLPGSVSLLEKHHAKVKDFADVNEKNAKEKHDAISKEQAELAKKLSKEEKDYKKEKIKKKILQLATLKSKIEKLHPEAFVKEETKSVPLTNEVSKTETPATTKKTPTEKKKKSSVKEVKQKKERFTEEQKNEIDELNKERKKRKTESVTKYGPFDLSTLEGKAADAETLKKLDLMNKEHKAIDKEINDKIDQIIKPSVAEKAEEAKQQELESEKKEEPIDHTANLQSVIKEIDNNKGKPIKGTLTSLPEKFNGKVGVEIEVDGKKQVVHIASSSTKVEQNANQKSTGKSLQGQYGIIPNALVESNAPVTLHLIKVGEVDHKGEAWNINGEHKNKYTGKPYGDKVEVWSGGEYRGVLQETVHPKEEKKLATPKTDTEKVQERFDEYSKLLEEKKKEKNPHKKGSSKYFAFEADRNKSIDKVKKEYSDISGKKQGLGISDEQIKAFVYKVLSEVAELIEKAKRREGIDKGYKELRKFLNANKEEITVEQAMEAEGLFESELSIKRDLIEQEKDTTGVNTQNMSSQARYFQDKEKVRSFYTGIRDFENDTQIEKMLNEVMSDRTFNDGKPFETNFKESIKKLYDQGRDELSDKKLSLAKHLEVLLNSKKQGEEGLTGLEKILQLSMFFRNTHNQPYIAMNIASKGAMDIIFVNGAYEKTLKDRVLHALSKITDKQFEQKVATFNKTKKTIADQMAFLTDITGLEKKYWDRFLLAPKIKGEEISKLTYFVIGNETSPKKGAIFTGRSKQDFINNLVNKKGSVVNTITLATPEHEQLSVIKPLFKDSEWNSRTSSSFTTHLINALSNVNNEVYGNEFYKNNNFVKQYVGKAKGAVIYMTSGASNVFKNKKFNAENMTDKDILQMMYANFTQQVKDAPSEDKGTYLQCLGQFGDKGFLSWTKCKRYTDIAEAKKRFTAINERNGLDAKAQEKMLIEESKEYAKQLFNSPSEGQVKQAELFAFNYTINYAEVNEVVNGSLQQYGKGQKGITALFKRNGSTASPGEAGSKYEKGGLGESHGVVLINAPKMPLLDNEGNHIEKWNDKLKKMVKQFFSFGDGQEYITREHSNKAKISTGGKYHSIIKAITSFTNPNGSRVLIKSGAIVIDELVKKFPENEAYKAILKTMQDAKVGRIVTVDAAKLREGTEVYNLFKDDSHELNPDAGSVSDKHIITVKTDDYLFQQDLVNDGKLQKSTTPIQRIKNMMNSKTAKAIQSQYNEIAKKKLDDFSEKISKIYGELNEKQKREAFTKFLLTNGKISSEEAQSLLDEFDAQGVTDDDLDFINTLLVAGVDTSHPILHNWAQKFIGNTIEKEALGRIANKVQLVEFANIPGKGFELRDYRKTSDGKTLLPEVAVPKSTGLRLPSKAFKTKEDAIATIINEKAKYRDMYDGESLTDDSYGNILEHEIEKTEKGWIIPGEYAMVTRVPADGMHSTTLARVKYHTPKEMGNVIITSTQMQQLSGSDFDGDTRFVEGFFKGAEGHILKDKDNKPLLNKKGQPKLGQVASNKQTPKGLANKAFHLDAQYFYDTKNFDEITSGIDGEAFDPLLKKLPPEKKYTAFGPKTFLNARTKNTTGLRVVGIAARYIGAYDYLKKHNAFLNTSKKDYFNEDKLLKQKSFRGKQIVLQEIKSNRDIPIGANNNGNKLTINLPLLKQKYTERAWTKSATQKDGSKSVAFAPNIFKSFEHFLTFVLLHETKHDTIKKKANETIGQYETRINDAAFEDLVENYNNPHLIQNESKYSFPIAKVNQSTIVKKEITKFVSGWQMKKVMGNLLNLALDNVKNPKIERLGLNEVTAPMFYTSLMLKPEGVSVEDWTENVVSYYTQSAVKKFVAKAREANSVFNEDKSSNAIGLIGAKSYNSETNKLEDDYSVFSAEEQKILSVLKTQYFIAQDINKLSTVIGATEKGIKSWAEYKNVKYIIDDINNNKLQNINTEKFVGSPFIQAAVDSADAMKEFLQKDSPEETKLAKHILAVAESEFDKIKKGELKEGRFSLKQFQIFSQSISDSMLTQSRKLKTDWSTIQPAFVVSILKSKKTLPSAIEEQIKAFNTLTAQYRALEATVKRLDGADKLNQLEGKKDELEALKPKILAEKEKLDDLRAKNTLVQMLDEKSRQTGEFINEEGKKIVEGKSYTSLGLRIDLQKQDMEADEKKAVYAAVNRIAKSDPTFMENFTNLVVFDTKMSTSRESGGLAQLLSPEIHEQIGNDMLAEKKKWNNDSYSKEQQQKITDAIFQNNPELLDKKYEKKLGESSIAKNYNVFSENELPVKMVSKERFEQVAAGTQNSIILLLTEDSQNYNTAKTVKAGYKLRIVLDGKEVVREVKNVTKESTNLATTVKVEFKPLVKEESKSEDIYSQLGNKTKSENVVIKPWGELKDATKPITDKGIVATRIKGTNYNFGNIFSHEFAGNLIKTKSIKEAVERYINWIITGETGEHVYDGIQPEEIEEKRDWVIEQLKSEELKGKRILYYKELGEPSHATALDYLINKYDWNKDNLQPKDYTNHSGGAIGSDSEWDKIGQEFGVTEHNHYWTEEKTPKGNKEITKEDYTEGQKKVTQAAKDMYGMKYQIKSSLLIRNWSQVKYADAIFAIGTLLKSGDKLNEKDDRVALIPQVKGGTGYAVQMAIREGKPVYVFDQTRNQWYVNEGHQWQKTGTPALTPNFAGIGTRQISPLGKKAIRDVYEKTFKNENSSSKEQWDTHKEELTKRHPDLIEEVWHNMTDAERKKAIECL